MFSLLAGLILIGYTTLDMPYSLPSHSSSTQAICDRIRRVPAAIFSSMRIEPGTAWDDLLLVAKGFTQFRDPYCQDHWIQPAANIMTALLHILADRDGVTCFSIMAHELCENRILDLLVTTDHWAIADFYDRPPGERLSIGASIGWYLHEVLAVSLADWRRLAVTGEMRPYTLLGILGIEPVSSREILDMITRASWFAEMLAAETGRTEV